MSTTGGLTNSVFSAHLLCKFCAIPLLHALENIQAKKIFLITPQNEATIQRKQIGKVTYRR